MNLGDIVEIKALESGHIHIVFKDVDSKVLRDTKLSDSLKSTLDNINTDYFIFDVSGAAHFDSPYVGFVAELIYHIAKKMKKYALVAWGKPERVVKLVSDGLFKMYRSVDEAEGLTMQIPKLVKIKKIVIENYKVKTFFLDIKLNAKPGQFVMVWIPEVDEKPFSLSCIGKETAVTVEKKGKFTEKMFGLKKGGLVGIRGPYGNGFSIKENACIVAGGLGLAPLLPLMEKIKNKTTIFGAKTGKDFLLMKELDKHKPNVCTDDGCVGFKGFTSDLLNDVLKKNKKIKIVYTCGPEVMMKKVFEICEKNHIECEASLERFMKCGIGICGACCIDDQRVCKDGPVFSSVQLRKLSELGKFARIKSGQKVELKDYFAWRGK